MLGPSGSGFLFGKPADGRLKPAIEFIDADMKGSEPVSTERLATRPDILDRRRETVEHPFGSIKQWMNQGAFLTRGLASVNAEFSLTSIAYNLRRAITILGIPAMLQTMQA